ncbi:MAG: hypothetical protein Q8N87_02800 [bacterium]|nr:hypothetical protein [bacterium]
MKNAVLTVVIVLLLMGLLGGCCCPTCPQEEVHPQILGTIAFCDLLEKAREWAPLAEYRWMMSESYELTSKADIEWALGQIGPWGCCIGILDLIDLFHGQSGYENVPFGYVKYSDGTMRNVAVYKDIVTGQIRALLLVDGEFQELISDSYITEIVI